MNVIRLGLICGLCLLLYSDLRAEEVLEDGASESGDEAGFFDDEQFGDSEWDDSYMGLAPEEEFIFGETTMVVSAAKYKQDIADAPSTVYVITERDIQRSGLTTIADVLRVVPGLDVTQLGSADTQVNARGMIQAPANKNLVLVDGMPVFSRAYNSVLLNGLPVVLEDIERIEVVLGPGSALYGGNAYAGIINILTQSPEESIGLHLRGSVGSQGSQYHSLIGATRKGRLGTKLSGSWSQSDRWRDGGDSEGMLRIGGVLAYEPTEDATVRAFGHIVKGFYEYFANPEAGHYKGDALIQYYMLDGAWRSLELKAVYRNISSEVETLPLVSQLAELFVAPYDRFPAVQDMMVNTMLRLRSDLALPIDENSWEVQGQHTLDPADWIKLIVGGDFHKYSIDWPMLDPEAPGSVAEWGAFAQATLFPVENVSLTLSGRYDNFQVADDRLSYRASLVYRFLPNHTLRVSTGTAFRNPAYAENYMLMRQQIIPGINLLISGNTDLKPESIETHEIGYNGSFLENHLKVQATAYYSDIQDFIHQRFSTDDPMYVLVEMATQSKYQNFGSAHSWGGEVALHVKLNEWITGFVNYTYQDLYFTTDDLMTEAVDEDGERIASPRHKVNAGVHYLGRTGFSADLLLHYVSATEWAQNLSWPIEKDLPPYVIVTGRVGYRFWQERMEAEITCQNLLHDIHQEYPYGDEIGTRFMFGMHLDF